MYLYLRRRVLATRIHLGHGGAGARGVCVAGMGDDGKRRHRERGVQTGSEHNKSTSHCQVSSVDLSLHRISMADADAEAKAKAEKLAAAKKRVCLPCDKLAAGLQRRVVGRMVY